MFDLDAFIKKYSNTQVKGSGALYKKVDGSYTDDKASEKYIQKDVYSSPNNVRRIFIGHTKMIIEYFKSPTNHDNKLTYEIKYFTIDKTGNKPTRIFVNALEEKIKVGDFGISGIQEVPVLNNIEEIYIDNDLFTKYNKNIAEKVYGKNIKEKVSKYLLDSWGGSSIETLNKRFPRFQGIYRVKDLENTFANVKRKSGLKGLEQYAMKWFEEYNIPKEQYETLCGLNGKGYINYEAQTSIYAFDKEILKDFFEAMKKDDAFIEQNIKKNKKDTKKEETKSDKKEKKEMPILEKIINQSFEDCKNKIGEELVKSTLSKAFAKMYNKLPNEKKQEIISEIENSVKDIQNDKIRETLERIRNAIKKAKGGE